MDIGAKAVSILKGLGGLQTVWGTLPFRKRPVSAFLKEKLALFEKDGYVVFNQPIDHADIDAFWCEVHALMETEPNLRFSRGTEILMNEERWSRTDIPDRPVIRAIDIERYSSLAPALFLHHQIVEFLTAYYQAPPTCLQTLVFEKSSEQGLHADKYLVSPATAGENYDRESLVASWVACEDADDDNGALILYPGSHHIPKPQFDDFKNNNKAYTDALGAICDDAGIKPKRFYAKKGDVLFWHADLVHAGGVIQDIDRTRRSLVSHYARLSPLHPNLDKNRRRRKYNGGAYFL